MKVQWVRTHWVLQCTRWISLHFKNRPTVCKPPCQVQRLQWELRLVAALHPADSQVWKLLNCHSKTYFQRALFIDSVHCSTEIFAFGVKKQNKTIASTLFQKSTKGSWNLFFFKRTRCTESSQTITSQEIFCVVFDFYPPPHPRGNDVKPIHKAAAICE